MNQIQEQSISKTIRIPVQVVRDIEQEAYEKNTTFSNVALYRLQHHENQLTPALLAKLQDIANLATEAVNESSPTKAEMAQKEVSELWKYLK